MKFKIIFSILFFIFTAIVALYTFNKSEDYKAKHPDFGLCQKDLTPDDENYEDFKSFEIQTFKKQIDSSNFVVIKSAKANCQLVNVTTSNARSFCGLRKENRLEWYKNGLYIDAILLDSTPCYDIRQKNSFENPYEVDELNFTGKRVVVKYYCKSCEALLAENLTVRSYYFMLNLQSKKIIQDK